MTMPHQRMNAFLQAGEVLWRIVKTTEHITRWGAPLPASLVSDAERVLKHYPNAVELQDAADDQRSMHTWMTRATRDVEQVDQAYGHLKAVAAQLGVEIEWEPSLFHNMPYLHVWLFNEHPALGYRAPDDFLDLTGNPEAIVELFRNEVSVLREATRVFRGKSKAYRWLRGLNRTLGAIPLEMLGTESGRRKVMDELDRLAAGGDLVR